MAQPPLQLPLPGPWGPPTPWMLPETIYPRGATNLCRLPGQEQPFPAAGAPPAQVAHQAPPPGLQRAPCGCCFDPRFFHMEWTSTILPPPATSMLGCGTVAQPGAILGGPGGWGMPLTWAAPNTHQSQPQFFVLYNPQGSAVTPDPSVLPVSIPSYQHIQGQLAQSNSSAMATPAGAPLGSSIPPGCDALPSPSANPQRQAQDLEGNITVSEEMLLEEALRLFGCSSDTLGVSEDGPSCGPVPGAAGGTVGEGTEVASGTNIPPGSDAPPSPSADPHSQVASALTDNLALPKEVPLKEALQLFGCSPDAGRVSQEDPGSGPAPGDSSDTDRALVLRTFTSLALPAELLTPNYSVPEISDAILSLEEFVLALEPQEPWGDAGWDLPPSQLAVAEKLGMK